MVQPNHVCRAEVSVPNTTQNNGDSSGAAYKPNNLAFRALRYPYSSAFSTATKSEVYEHVRLRCSSTKPRVLRQSHVTLLDCFYVAGVVHPADNYVAGASLLVPSDGTPPTWSAQCSTWPRGNLGILVNQKNHKPQIQIFHHKCWFGLKSANTIICTEFAVSLTKHGMQYSAVHHWYVANASTTGEIPS